MKLIKDKDMKRTITLIMTALLLGACSQDTSLPSDGPLADGATPLQVDDIVLEASVPTRAATTLATDNATIGTFCSKEAGYDAVQANIPYMYSTATSKWAPKVSDAALWLLAYNANVCAYYPYNAAYTNNTAIPLATAVYATAGDICFAPNRVMNGTPSKSKTTFAMQRAMAMIVFTLKKGNYPGTCKVTGITLSNTNLPATGTINITAAGNTAVTVTKANLTYTPLSTGDMTVTTTGQAAQSVLVVPFTLSGNFTVTLTVDGKTMKIELPATTFTGSKIEAGKRYLLTLKLNGTALDVTNVSIENWTDVPMTDTGGKDYEPIPAS